MLFMNSLGAVSTEILQYDFGVSPATYERVRTRVCQAIINHGSCMLDPEDTENWIGLKLREHPPLGDIKNILFSSCVGGNNLCLLSPTHYSSR